MAGAGAFDGKRRQFNAHLIERTALTFAPGCLIALAEIAPDAHIRQLLPGGSGTAVGRQREDLIARKLHAFLPPPHFKSQSVNSAGYRYVLGEYGRSGQQSIVQ